MAEQLTTQELIALIVRVFQPRVEDRAVGVLVDLPDAHTPDRPAWAERRALAADWVERLRSGQDQLGLPVDLVLFENVRMNNADLPKRAWVHRGRLPSVAGQLAPAEARPFAEIFERYRILLAPTEFSATAPLKLAAREHLIRAATMPGFSAAMIPALRLDYQEINRRVDALAALLERASGADLSFGLDDGRQLDLHLDLRHRPAHASGGIFPQPGQAGNLPSGESYIVPYEGELPGDPSRSAGQLPVQFEQELVVYRIQGNRAVEVLSQGAWSEREAARLAAEPAYGNLAELGLGVLADFGLVPTGETLLDEKLGLHIAFGRSDHFGGQVGAAQFSAPDQVVHIDRVYLPAIQSRITVRAVDLVDAEAGKIALIRDGQYQGAF
jgi:hypothetical protein